ncbi:DUF1853 family protein [Tenacibaculum sp. IB213877]|uniref:DUF1853 family protein n=1 Tax=Tenacibaculum sp. IB213877 TaxID=3097351 RepID=UPI002A59F9DA|nr:DUF1853 family protein [Tenacibaculum sp. IB213877]MDY0779551.1 DUF1853 family protein [Tenacibaculum sp. IB213877]
MSIPLNKALQLQYQGFLQTPFLWHSSIVENLQQFDLQCTHVSLLIKEIKRETRLGKLVEQFVFHQLNQDNSIKTLAENIQIQNGKITLGEIDCLLVKDSKPIHLEIIYKFYLYDESVGDTEVEHWIGPNRRDSLIEKLTKLKEKQLPLLYHPLTKPILDELKLSSDKIKQQVYFKAQLFVPLQDFGKEFELINNSCIEGFYIYEEELEQFSNCKFYIPTKHNWLIKPFTQIHWLNYNDFKSKLSIFLAEENSPLCWVKKPNGEMMKFFVVWWSK